jgi:epoxide hydrolase-like predicted phosphatase
VEKNNILAVIFDMGGVLYDWQKGWRETARKLGSDYEELIKIVLKLAPSAELGELSLSEFFQKVGEDAGLGNRWKQMDRDIPFNFPRIDETFKLLEMLKGKYKLAVLTNNPPEIMDRWEKVGDYKKYFDIIIDSSEVGLRKPSKEIFMLTCQELKLSPEECLFIEDSKEHIEAAQKLGFKVVHFTNPKRGVKKIKSVLGLM